DSVGSSRLAIPKAWTVVIGLFMLIKPGTTVSLKAYGPDDSGPYASPEEAEEALRKQLDELSRLQNLLYAESRRALLIVLQGMDPSGEDGAIRHVVGGLGPWGVWGMAFNVPSESELVH